MNLRQFKLDDWKIHGAFVASNIFFKKIKKSFDYIITSDNNASTSVGSLRMRMTPMEVTKSIKQAEQQAQRAGAIKQEYANLLRKRMVANLNARPFLITGRFKQNKNPNNNKN